MHTGKLTQKFIRNTESTRSVQSFSDGNGLYLVVQPSGSMQWVARLRLTGRRNSNGKPLQIDMGLGGLSWVSLQDARQKIFEARAVARNGGDPRKTKTIIIPSFAELSQKVYEERLPSWKNLLPSRLGE